MDWRDIGIRAAKTAAQSFLAVLIPAVTVEGLSELDKVALAALVAAIAAALSVFQNALTQALRK